MISTVAGKHSPNENPVTVYAPKPLKPEAMSLLKARGWDMRAYLVACLAALIADPDAELAAKAPHRPPEKPNGRPPRTDREQP